MREKGIHKIEVHVAAVCFTQALPLRILALHRTSKRALFPNFWEGVGGQVLEGESLEEAALRHLHEEAGINGRIICPYAAYIIEPGLISGADKRIPGIRFLVVIEGTPKITINPEEHQGWGWAALNKLQNFDWIPGLREQIEAGSMIYETLLENTCRLPFHIK